jgi:hypothetical protein
MSKAEFTIENAKHIVKEIFGEEEAEDTDVVDFYHRCNKIAMEEFAEAYLQNRVKAITEEEIKSTMCGRCLRYTAIGAINWYKEQLLNKES